MNTRLKPFFGYFGSKWRLAPYYQPPKYDLIIEPFAGSAGYSLLYPNKQIILCDSNPAITSIWEYLTKTTPADIEGLPDTITEELTEGQKSLIGFWYAKASTVPRKIKSPWSDKYPGSSWWGPKIRKRISNQLEAIKHWQIVAGDYTTLPDIEATWFIDPPYQFHGKGYPHSSKRIDFSNLAEWCKSRKGQVIVCEGGQADWLPFTPFRKGKRPTGQSQGKGPAEVVWYSDPIEVPKPTGPNK